MDLIEFEGDLDAFAKQVRIDYTKVLKRVAFDLFTRIVQKTPVDTGRARASWNLTIGTPDLSVAPEGQYPEMKTEIVIAKFQEALVEIEGKMLGKTLTYPIYITNNLPYILELEHGRRKVTVNRKPKKGEKPKKPKSQMAGSIQAPEGMVALSIEEVKLKMSLLMKVPE